LIQSPLTGPKGNIEFLTLLNYPAASQSNVAEWLEGLYPVGAQGEEIASI
jgi:hypothetical protein